MVGQTQCHIMELQVHENICRYNLLNDSQSVIVALSGGADSVALLSVLVSLGYRCVAAHCNFHLRGDESNRDESHAVALAQQMGLKCEVTHFDVSAYESQYGVSTEMACRELRYEWFEQLRQKYDAQAIAVAHHRDDDVETMFLNLLRGSGIAGAAGMKWKNGYVVRPMLNLSRMNIEEYINSKGLSYVIDSTNLENEYKRNRLRNEVLPVLNKYFPGADEMLAKSLGHLKEHRAIYCNAIDEAIMRYKQDDVIKLSELIAEYVSPTTLLFEILNPLGFNISQVENIIKAVDDTGRKFYASQWIAVVNRGDLLLTPNDAFSRAEEVFVIDLRELKREKRTLDLSHLPLKLRVNLITLDEFSPVKDGTEIYLDANALDLSSKLVLRRWREGDRIAPFGMKGTKKISDIFSDAKLSLAQKNDMWILEHNGSILWVVGLRASRHFAINDATTHILCIKNLQSGY